VDFSLKRYVELLNALQSQGFSFLPFFKHGNLEAIKTILLRQDVDLLPKNSLEFARIQAVLGIRSTFYFRAVQESFDEGIMREIAGLGHEVGYHYEDVSLEAERLKAVGGRQKDISKKYEVGSKEYEEFEKQLVNIAIESFSENLERLRKLAPVKTICMHGSPMSRWDSRLLWKYYDYHDFGIIGEPYFDIDFNQVLYLTDTGRRWDGGDVSVRDKASGDNTYKDWKVRPIKYRDNFKEPATSNQQPATFPSFHSTSDIIKAAEVGELPDKIMMTFHPQRWTDKRMPWVKELVWQNVKNVGKYFLVRRMR